MATTNEEPGVLRETIRDPLIVSRGEVLELMKRTLSGELDHGEAYLFAFDILEGASDGTVRLEDPRMYPPLERLLKLKSVSLSILEDVVSELYAPVPSGHA